MPIVIQYSRSISTKGQVTLPRTVREMLGVKPHDYVRFVIKQGVIQLQSPTMTLTDVFKLAKSTKSSKKMSFKQMRKLAREEYIEGKQSKSTKS